MSLLDPKWRYTPSHSTDIRKRFEQERKRLESTKKEKTNVCKLATATGTRRKGNV